jgi:hypothetical protein
MSSAIVLAQNILPEPQRSFRTSTGTPLATEPHADLPNATASHLEAILNLSQAKAHFKKTVGHMRGDAAQLIDQAYVTCKHSRHG